jgi:SAM-dependent methyltransferase
VPTPGGSASSVGRPPMAEPSPGVRLAAATAEIVDFLCRWSLLRPGVRVLDYGCGVGRLTAALSDRDADVVGVDISPAMLAAARARHPRLRFEETGGLDLASHGRNAFDLVLMVDVLPDVVRGGYAAASRLLGEAARVLADGGRLVAFNFGHSGNDAADRIDFERICAAHGLVPERRGTRDLVSWDGAAWVAVRRPVSFAPPNLGGM